MNAESNTPSLMEMKAALNGHFATVKEDKFTEVKIAELNDPGNTFQWTVLSHWVSGGRESAKALTALGGTANSLVMGVDYRRKDDTDAVFFTFSFAGRDSNFIGMDDLHVYLILDDQDRIELSELSAHKIDTEVNSENQIIYAETAQITVPISDMMAIASADKIEYRFQFSALHLEDTFEDRDLISLKGFFNNVFDEDFAVERLYKAIKAREAAEKEAQVARAKPVAKNKPQPSGCYVATLVYGSYDHPSVMTLRQFRDDRLLTLPMGRRLVSIYYKTSPHLVSWLQGKPKTNTLIRGLLDRIVSRLETSK